VVNQAIKAQPLDTSKVSRYLNEVRVAVGLENINNAHHTTHCFRRGGAQHKFFFAKKRFTLTDLKAWGGWSQGDSNNTIIQYLMDDYAAREADSRFFYSPFYTGTIDPLGAAPAPDLELANLVGYVDITVI
jgi:hypothetical protein